MSSSMAIVTPEDLLQMGCKGKSYELIDGQLKELVTSPMASRVGGQVYWELQSFCKAHLAGWAFPPEAAFRCFSDDPGRVRKPDASFIALERLTRSECEEDAFLEVVPDLVVEAISPNDKAEDVERKIEDWLQAGVEVL